MSDPWSKAAKDTKDSERSEVRGSVDPTTSLSAPTFVLEDPEELEAMPFSDIMTKLGFQSLQNVRLQQKLCIATHGRKGFGKTFFGLSASAFEGKEIKSGEGTVVIPPGYPVVVIGTEDGSRQHAPKIPSKYSDRIFLKEIYREDPQTLEEDPIRCIQELDKTISLLRTMKQGTIVVDSMTDVIAWLNGVLRKKVLKISPTERIVPSDYFWRNSKLQGILMKLKSIPNVHVILTAKDVELVQDAKLTPTNIYKPKWHHSVPYAVDIVLGIERRVVKNDIIRWGEITATRFETEASVGKVQPLSFTNLVETVLPAFVAGSKDQDPFKPKEGKKAS